MRAPFLSLAALVFVPAAVRAAGALVPRASSTPHRMNFYYVCPVYEYQGKTIYNNYQRGAAEYDTGNFACTFYDTYTAPTTYTYPGLSQGLACVYNNEDGTIQPDDPGSDSDCAALGPPMALKLDTCVPTCPLVDNDGKYLWYLYWAHENDPRQPIGEAYLECLYGLDPDTFEYSGECHYHQTNSQWFQEGVGYAACPSLATDTCATGQYNGRKRAYRGEDNFTALMGKRKQRAAIPSASTNETSIPSSMRIRSSLGKRKRERSADF